MAKKTNEVKMEKVANTEPNNCPTWKTANQEWTIRQETTTTGRFGFSIYQFGTYLSTWSTRADAIGEVWFLAGSN